MGRTSVAAAALAISLVLYQYLGVLGSTGLPDLSSRAARAGRRQQPLPQAHSAKRTLRGSCKCGVAGQDEVDTRIVGGIQASPHVFPWMVAILFDGYMNCGGSLINDRYVLTAGHCLVGLTPQNISVMMGLNDLLTLNRVLPPVDQLIVHEEFSRDYLHDINDVALIRLAKPVAFSDNVRPICLPQYATEEYAGRLAVVAGWGRVGQDKPLSRYLRTADVRVISNKLCRNTPIGEHISDNMLCTYYEKKDACQGDSGGPLVSVSDDGRYEQIGVVSWGIGCARPNMPGVFSRITSFLSWVHYNTRDAQYCSRN